MQLNSRVDHITQSYEPFFSFLKRNRITQTYLEDESIIPTGTMQLLRENKPICFTTMYYIMSAIGIEKIEDFVRFTIVLKDDTEK